MDWLFKCKQLIVWAQINYISKCNFHFYLPSLKKVRETDTSYFFLLQIRTKVVDVNVLLKLHVSLKISADQDENKDSINLDGIMAIETNIDNFKT